MIATTCQSVRRTLGAFVDGELPGVQMLRAAAHLEACDTCAAELEAIRQVGESLRDTARLTPSPAMDGLADGVVTRLRVERTQSWSAVFERGMHDWHWAVVGLGSFASTSVMTLFVAAVLAFGPAAFRADSLAALLSEPVSQPMFMQMYGYDDPVNTLTQVAQGVAVPRRDNGDVAFASFLAPSSDLELVQQLLSHSDGGFVDFQTMDGDDRRYAEALSYQISRRRLTTSRMFLISSTTVSASGL